MGNSSGKKVDDTFRTQSGIRETLIEIASEGRRQVNVQPTSPSYVSDLKSAVNEIAAGVAGTGIKSRGNVIRVVAASPRQKRERIIVNH